MNVEDTIRDFWATRPRRSEDDRKIGGVAAAIGRRYGIDPVLVRVGFVVATFFSGAGILLYLLGWLLLPARGDAVCAAEGLLGRGHSSMSSGLTLVLGLALIPITGIVFADPALGMLGLAAGLAAMFYVHHGRATMGEIPTTGEGTGEGVRGAVPAAKGTVGAAHVPLSPVLPPARRPRSKVTPITLGLALLIGGITSALWPALVLAHIAALVLGVVGIGLVVGSLVRPRSGRALIVVAIPLAVLTWVLHAMPDLRFGIGESGLTPGTVTQLQPPDVPTGEAVSGPRTGFVNEANNG